MRIFDALIDQFYSSMAGWETTAIGIAKDLFYWLVLIQIIWTGILFMINRDDPVHHMLEFTKRVIVISFFLLLIDQAGNFVPMIVNGFRQAGAEISGVGQFSPGDVARKGIYLATTLLEASHDGGFLEKMAGAFLGVIVGLLVALCFIYTAIEITLLLIGTKVILVGGIITLGLSGTQWTSDYVQRFIQGAIFLGLKIFFMTLIVGLGETITDQWVVLIKDAIVQDHLFETYFSILAGSLLYATLVLKIPDLGASLLSGGVSMNFGAASLMAGTVLGASYLMKQTQNAMKGLGEGAMQSAGRTSAIYQALQYGESKAQNTSGGTLSKLSAGISGTVQSVASGMGAAMNESISKTSGGKIANHIKTLRNIP